MFTGSSAVLENTALRVWDRHFVPGQEQESNASQQGIPRLPQAFTPASVHSVATTPRAARRPPPHTTLVKMSSHVVVVSPDVKRVSVKVNPGTYMFDVLDEACKKLNLQVDKWSLK